MPRLLLASSAPSGPTQEPLAKPGLNSTASITASSMTLTHWSRRSASRPLHDNTTEREQNPHSRHYNGMHAAIRPVLVESPHRSEEHTSELQSHLNLVCRLLLEKKKKK